MTEERRGQEGGGEDVPQEIAEIVNARAIFNTMNHPEPETFLIGESRNRGFGRAGAMGWLRVGRSGQKGP